MRPIIISIGLIVFLTLIGAALYSNNTGVRQIDPTPGIQKGQIQALTPTPSLNVSNISIYLVSLEGEIEGEEFGCGDTLIPIVKSVSSTEPIRTALELLISENDKTYYNALVGSNLKIDKIVQTDKVSHVYLTGELSLGGVCDNPRVEEQLKNTIISNSNSNSVTIYLNEILLEEVLSLEN